MILQQGGALGDEGSAVFGTVFVGGADDLDGRDQAAATLLVENADFVGARGGEVGHEREGRLRQRPNRSRHRASSPLLGPRFGAAEWSS